MQDSRERRSYVTLDEAKDLLRVSVEHATGLCRKGRIACVREGKGWRIERESLAAFLIERDREKECKKGKFRTENARGGSSPVFVPYDIVHKVGALVASLIIVFGIFGDYGAALSRLASEGISYGAQEASAGASGAYSEIIDSLSDIFRAFFEAVQGLRFRDAAFAPDTVEARQVFPADLVPFDAGGVEVE